jgi:hypothetical protein
LFDFNLPRGSLLHAAVYLQLDLLLIGQWHLGIL